MVPDAVLPSEDTSRTLAPAPVLEEPFRLRHIRERGGDSAATSCMLLRQAQTRESSADVREDVEQLRRNNARLIDELAQRNQHRFEYVARRVTVWRNAVYPEDKIAPPSVNDEFFAVEGLSGNGFGLVGKETDVDSLVPERILAGGRKVRQRLGCTINRGEAMDAERNPSDCVCGRVIRGVDAIDVLLPSPLLQQLTRLGWIGKTHHHVIECG